MKFITLTKIDKNLHEGQEVVQVNTEHFYHEFEERDELDDSTFIKFYSAHGDKHMYVKETPEEIRWKMENEFMTI